MKVAEVIAVVAMISAYPAEALAKETHSRAPKPAVDYTFWNSVERDGAKAIGKVVEVPGYRLNLASESFEFDAPFLQINRTKLLLHFRSDQKKAVMSIPVETAMDNPLVTFKIKRLRTFQGAKVYDADFIGQREAPDMCYKYGDVEVPGAGDAARKLTSGPYQRFGYLRSLYKKGNSWFATVRYAQYYWGTEAIREAKKDGTNAPDCYYIRDDKPMKVETLAVDAECPFVHLTTDMRTNTLTWYSIDELSEALQGKRSLSSQQPTLSSTYWFSVKGGKLNLIADQYFP